MPDNPSSLSLQDRIARLTPAQRADLEARDLRDSTRAVAPLKPAEGARLLDNSNLTIDESVQQVLAWWSEKRG